MKTGKYIPDHGWYIVGLHVHVNVCVYVTHTVSIGLHVHHDESCIEFNLQHVHNM